MRQSREQGSEVIFREVCREHGLRVTQQRLAIFKLLQDSADHPNADVIFRKIRRRYSQISFDTVNRTLLCFARIGILKVVEGYGYPKRYDPRLECHHHFHCVKCNRIIDFHEGAVDAIRIPESISMTHVILDRKIVLEGICDRCKR